MEIPTKGLAEGSHRGAGAPHRLSRGTWKAVPSQGGKSHFLIELSPGQEEAEWAAWWMSPERVTETFTTWCPWDHIELASWSTMPLEQEMEKCARTQLPCCSLD